MGFYFHVGGGGHHGRSPRDRMHNGHHHNRMWMHHRSPSVHVHKGGFGSFIAFIIMFLFVSAFIGFIFFKMF